MHLVCNYRDYYINHCILKIKHHLQLLNFVYSAYSTKVVLPICTVYSYANHLLQKGCSPGFETGGF